MEFKVVLENLITQICEFTPIRSDSKTNTYLKYNLKSFSKCIESEIYTGAFYYLHLFYMTLVYHQLSRILNDHTLKRERSIALSGFSREENDLYVGGDEKIHPSSFSIVNEKTVFRLFRTIAEKDNSLEKSSTKIIKRRNNYFHAKQESELNEDNLISIMNEYISNLQKIAGTQEKFLIKQYKESLDKLSPSDVNDMDDLETTFNNFSIYELKFLTDKYSASV